MSPIAHKTSEQLPVGRLVRPIARVLAVEPDATYALLGAHWYGKGLYTKDIKPGTAIRARSLYRVKEGDFVYNRLFAWMGSFAVASAENDGCYVSNEFLCYEIDRDTIEADYMWWYFRRPATWRIALGLSTGSTPTSRNRLKEGRFLDMVIPVPDLHQQRRVVGHLTQLAAKTAQAVELRAMAIAQRTALARSWRNAFFDSGESEVAMGTVVSVIDPNPSHRYPTYTTDGIPMVSTSDFVGDDGIELGRSKRVPAAFWDETLGKCGVGAGDIVFARKGRIGYARPYPTDDKVAMTHTLCVLQPNRAAVDERYLLHFSRSQRFLDYLLRTMNPNSGVPTLGLDVIRAATMPLPTIERQIQIAAVIDAMEEKLHQLEELQGRSDLQIDQLLTSAIEDAFARLSSSAIPAAN
jgi:type I restriction enzyme S subunit